ncbi:hypothetical protein CP532_6270 [Ophiocordyceps camponoti-leonardi (nom. inval.)]|nr:hypothetical protein CP532_6270 [Ophiocordyceps camponoti-leonardi (nom. inval.)]
MPMTLYRYGIECLTLLLVVPSLVFSQALRIDTKNRVSERFESSLFTNIQTTKGQVEYGQSHVIASSYVDETSSYRLPNMARACLFFKRRTAEYTRLYRAEKLKIRGPRNKHCIENEFFWATEDEDNIEDRHPTFKDYISSVRCFDDVILYQHAHQKGLQTVVHSVFDGCRFVLKTTIISRFMHVLHMKRVYWARSANVGDVYREADCKGDRFTSAQDVANLFELDLNHPEGWKNHNDKISSLRCSRKYTKKQSTTVYYGRVAG